MKRYDIGHKFGKLTLLERFTENGKTYYRCECECGSLKNCLSSNVTSGNTTSCGCYRKEACRLRERKKNHPTHGVMLTYYKRNAKKSGREFLLSREEFDDLIFSTCYYCGADPQERSIIYWYHRDGEPARKEFKANGIDRLNNDLGYIKSNCVSCCASCNNMKGTMTYNEFIRLVTLIAEHHRKE